MKVRRFTWTQTHQRSTLRAEDLWNVWINLNIKRVSCNVAAVWFHSSRLQFVTFLQTEPVVSSEYRTRFWCGEAWRPARFHIRPVSELLGRRERQTDTSHLMSWLIVNQSINICITLIHLMTLPKLSRSRTNWPSGPASSSWRQWWQEKLPLTGRNLEQNRTRCWLQIIWCEVMKPAQQQVLTSESSSVHMP